MAKTELERNAKAGTELLIGESMDLELNKVKDQIPNKLFKKKSTKSGQELFRFLVEDGSQLRASPPSPGFAFHLLYRVLSSHLLCSP